MLPYLDQRHALSSLAISLLRLVLKRKSGAAASLLVATRDTSLIVRSNEAACVPFSPLRGVWFDSLGASQSSGLIQSSDWTE
jgi:hypothetical protein